MKRLVRWRIATAIIAGVILVLGDARDPWLWGYIATFSLIGAYAMYAIDDDLAKERFTPPSKGADRLSLAWVPSHRGGPHHRRHCRQQVRMDERPRRTTRRWPDRIRPVVHADRQGDARQPVLFRGGPHSGRQGPSCRRQRSLFRRTTPGIRRDDRVRAAERAGARVVAQRRRCVRLLGTGRPACSLRRSVLRTNLDGYQAYTERVRYRLVPGLF